MIAISGYATNLADPGLADKESYFNVMGCGYQKYISKDLTSLSRPLGRLDYQLIYIASGQAWFQISGHQKPIGEGELVVYAPYQEQQYSYYHRDKPEVYWMHFSGYAASQHLTDCGLEATRSFVGICNQYSLLFNRIIQELQLKRCNYRHAACACALELTALMGRHHQEQYQQGEVSAALYDIAEYMHKNYCQKLSIAYCADKINMSRYWFIKRFKQQFGMPPYTYLISIRMKRAKELLRNSSLTVSEIGESVGYGNPLYFSRLFKQCTGQSPSGYRSDSRKLD